VEGRIGTLEADKTAREEMLCDPAVLRNGDRARLLHGELRCIRTDLEKLYERWSDLGQRIEALEATSPASGPADGGPRNP
jgi:hypothetical protein